MPQQCIREFDSSIGDFRVSKSTIKDAAAVIRGFHSWIWLENLRRTQKWKTFSKTQNNQKLKI